MKLNPYFKSISEQDTASVVICDLSHKILYMNPAAIAHYHGKDLSGMDLLACHNDESQEKIRTVVRWFSTAPNHNIVHTFFNEKQNKDGYMVALRDEDGTLIGYYEKHEYRTLDDSPFYDLP